METWWGGFRKEAFGFLLNGSFEGITVTYMVKNLQTPEGYLYTPKTSFTLKSLAFIQIPYVWSRNRMFLFSCFSLSFSIPPLLPSLSHQKMHLCHILTNPKHVSMKQRQQPHCAWSISSNGNLHPIPNSAARQQLPPSSCSPEIQTSKAGRCSILMWDEVWIWFTVKITPGAGWATNREHITHLHSCKAVV